MTGPDSAYDRKLQEELANYRDVEMVHDLPPIAEYWAATHLVPIARQFGFSTITQFYCQYILKFRSAQPSVNELHIISIGAGNCDQEAEIAGQLVAEGVSGFVIECVDINPDMLERGRQAATEKNLLTHMAFNCGDVAATGMDRTAHIIIANQSLHHMVELELMFSKICECLHPQGYFLTHDMIGRNGHQRWPEALRIIEQLWSELPSRYKYNHQLQTRDEMFVNRDCSQEGFEGIRAQDILPLLTDRFDFELFLAYGNLIDVFVDRGYGPNFAADSIDDRQYIDRIHALDQQLLESGEIKPTRLLAAMMHKGAGAELQCYRNLTPQFCLRDPDKS